MFQSLTRQWRGMLHGAPGRRFRESYAAARKKPPPLWQRLFCFGLALVAFVLGLAFAILPGPASIFFVVSGALLAAESLALARFLDWGEMRLRVLAHWANAHWKRLGRLGRAAVIVLGTMGSVTMTVLVWRFWFH
ncbi:MAG: hypothetical protein JWM88_275 [Verrucomicrobia bacterium]|nr:hypothetical protein [Verrucomicrobiota bacterium]